MIRMDNLNYKDFLQYILPSDIPESSQAVVDLIGIEAFVKLCEYFMGDEFYFPTVDTIFRKTRNRLIIQEYNGYNIKLLSKKYRLTTVQIHSILKGK